MESLCSNYEAIMKMAAGPVEHGEGTIGQKQQRWCHTWATGLLRGNRGWKGVYIGLWRLGLRQIWVIFASAMVVLCFVDFERQIAGIDAAILWWRTLNQAKLAPCRIAHTPFKYPGSGGGSLCAWWVGTHQHPAIPNFDSKIGYRLLDF